MKMRSRAAVAAVVLAVISLAFVVESLAEDSSSVAVDSVVPSAGNSDVAAAEQVLSRAIVLRQTSIVPPGNKPVLATNKGRTEIARPSSFRPTAAEASVMVAAGERDLPEVFSGRALAAEQKKLHNAAEVLQVGEVLVLGGGADKFSFSDPITVDEKTLKIKVRAEVWAQFAQIQEDALASAVPTNIIDFDATMSLGDDGQWRVSDLIWEFAPGGGP